MSLSAEPVITSAVIRVGDGRGFLVEWPRRQERLVVTAAHCLPAFPAPHPAAYTEERTYPNLLGPLDADTGSVWAELLFADPIADLAVLGSTDDQALPDEADAYDEFVEGRPVLGCRAIAAECAGWVLTLDQAWVRCTVQPGPHGRGRLKVLGAKTPNGTSGSPILHEAGAVVGVVSCADMHPRLSTDLPGWLLTELGIV